MPGSELQTSSFCHVFVHEDRHYAYDIGSNGLYEIDAVLAAVLPLWGPHSAEEVVDRLADRHGRETVLAAIAEILAARGDEGLFLQRRPLIKPFVLSQGERQAYDNRLGHLILSVTEACNLRCRYCLHGSTRNWVRSHGDQHMSVDTALRALEYFATRCQDADTPAVSFYGGEPLLHFELIEAVVETARQRDDWPTLRFNIDTNGVALATLDQERIAFLCREKIHLQISLDGPAVLHDRHRVTAGGAPTHGAIMTGLRRLLEHDRDAAERLSFIVTLAPPYDLQTVCDYFAPLPLFTELGIDHVPAVRVDMVDLAGTQLEAAEDTLEQAEERRRQLTQARQHYVGACGRGERDGLSPALKAYFDQGLIRYYHRSRAPLPECLRPTGSCIPGQRRLHVKADGTLQPCERVGEKLVIGQAEQGINVDAAERMTADLHRLVRPECAECWAVRLCTLCLCALAPTGSADDPAATAVVASQCDGLRQRQESVFRLYLSLQDESPHALDFLKNTSIR